MKTQEILILEDRLSKSRQTIFDQKKIISALKLENYQHMRDKVYLHDQIYQRDLLDIARKVGDNGETEVEMW